MKRTIILVVPLTSGFNFLNRVNQRQGVTSCKENWSSWSLCSCPTFFNRNSIQTRYRERKSPYFNTCFYDSETRACNNFTPWSPCDASKCGTDFQTRANTCSKTVESLACPNKCVCQLSEYSACDCLTQTKIRTTLNAYCGVPAGSVFETKKCEPSECQCDYTAWSECPSDCSIKNAVQRRTSQFCPTETRFCPETECQCKISEWSTCSQSCGTGIQTKTALNEFCDVPIAFIVDKRECQNECNCEYSSWSACDETCTQIRTALDQDCPIQREERQCDISECDCVYGEWSTCSANCGEGYQTRYALTDSCIDLSQTQVCTGSCNCNYSEWSPCTASCGTGMKYRSKIESDPNCLPLATESFCDLEPCPCQWSEWSPCSVACGEGIQTRVIDSENCEAKKETKICKPDCVEELSNMKCEDWLVWENWSECSDMCSGLRKRVRRNACDNNQIEEEWSECKESAKSPWSSWSACTLSEKCTSNIGSQFRTRQSNPCDYFTEKLDFEYTTCELPKTADIFYSTWSAWSNCNYSTKKQLRQRQHECNDSTDYPIEFEEQECTPPTLWSEWSIECIGLCDHGVRIRKEVVEFAKTIDLQYELKYCSENVKGDLCEMIDCHGPWSSWAYNKKIGRLFRSRQSKCSSGPEYETKVSDGEYMIDPEPAPTSEPEATPEPESTPEPVPERCSLKSIQPIQNTIFSDQVFPDAIRDMSDKIVATTYFGGTYTIPEIEKFCVKNPCKYIVNYGFLDATGVVLAFATNSDHKREGGTWDGWNSRDVSCLFNEKEADMFFENVNTDENTGSSSSPEPESEPRAESETSKCLVKDRVYSVSEENFPDYLVDENGYPIATKYYGGNYDIADLDAACDTNINCEWVVKDKEGNGFATSSNNQLSGDKWIGFFSSKKNCDDLVEHVIDSIDTGNEVKPEPESDSEPDLKSESEPTSDQQPESTVAEPEPSIVPDLSTEISKPEPSTAPEPGTAVAKPEPSANPEPETAVAEPSTELEIAVDSCIESDTVYSNPVTFPTYLVNELNEPVATPAFGGSYTLESILDYCKEKGCLHVVYYGAMADTIMAFATNSTEKLTGDDYLNWNTNKLSCTQEVEECEFENLATISDTVYSDNFPDILKDDNGNLIATLSFGGNMLLADIVNACRRVACRYIVHYGDDSESLIAFATNSTVKQEGDFKSWYSRPAFCLSGINSESILSTESIQEPYSMDEPEQKPDAQPESTPEPESKTDSNPEPESTPEPDSVTEPESSPEIDSNPEPESTPEPTSTPQNKYVPPSDAACSFSNLPYQLDTAYFSAAEGFPAGAIIDSNGNMVATEDLGGSYSKEQIFDYCHNNLCKYIVHLGPIDQPGPMLIYATNSSETNFFSGWRSVQTACMSQKRE